MYFLRSLYILQRYDYKDGLVRMGLKKFKSQILLTNFMNAEIFSLVYQFVPLPTVFAQ